MGTGLGPIRRAIKRQRHAGLGHIRRAIERQRHWGLGHIRRAVKRQRHTGHWPSQARNSQYRIPSPRKRRGGTGGGGGRGRGIHVCVVDGCMKQKKKMKVGRDDIRDIYIYMWGRLCAYVCVRGGGGGYDNHHHGKEGKGSPCRCR